jgi:creatinine amidohydrolase/Fe(II)-dependent formamide hydrolase-like protein
MNRNSWNTFAVAGRLRRQVRKTKAGWVTHDMDSNGSCGPAARVSAKEGEALYWRAVGEETAQAIEEALGWGNA